MLVFISEFPIFQQKSHTCEEGGTHLRISFWHLLMNLKNKQLLKKMLKWANKKQNNFNIYNVKLKKKKNERKNTCRYHYQNLDNIIYHDLQVLRYRAKHTEIGNFSSSFTLLPP